MERTFRSLKHHGALGIASMPGPAEILCAAILLALVVLNGAAFAAGPSPAEQNPSNTGIAAPTDPNIAPKATVPEKVAAEPDKSTKQSLADKIAPPHDSVEKFVQFMTEQRKEDPSFLEQRYNRYLAVVENKDLWREKETRAFLLTPREKFCRKWNLKRAYDHAFLDIKYGVTISGPHLVSRMTSSLDVQPGEKVLEIGTGSGYQSAVISYLTDQVFTIEIIEKLAEETDKLYKDLGASGYPEYNNIKRKADDGYYGWEEYAPFDKIIVTCGIDHIPPPLLKQLKVGGAMVIPVGPPGAQIVMRVTKNQDQDGNVVIAREDIYHGQKKVPFVPFTKKGGGTHFNK